MAIFTRRNFLKVSGGMMLIPAAGGTTVLKAAVPRLSFSTLGCPDWSFDKIIEFGSKHGYQGIEIRGIQRELDLTKSPAFNSPAAIAESRKKANDHSLKFVGLGSSAALHHKETAERKKALDEAKRFIELAHALGCGSVRVFPNNLPAGVPKEETLQLISAGLTELGAVAKGSGVKVLMETHGDLIYAQDIAKVMTAAGNQDNIGLVWDISNMWSVTKESPTMVYGLIKKWILHIHLKDLKNVNGKDQYTLFGDGEVPAFEAIDLLAKNRYPGFYSFEWEKMWHPEIAEPEIALADFPEKMKAHFKS